MTEPVPISIVTKPGVKRDGTRLDGDFYQDAQWVRWQRGRPRKIGGYREIPADFAGPVSAVQVWSRSGTYIAVAGSPWGIEQISVGETGVGAALSDRTPTPFAVDQRLRWQFDVMYDAAVGSDKSLIIAHASATADDIDDPTVLPVYVGAAADDTAFTAIGGVSVSGGIVALHPYLMTFGSDGQVSWSNANEPQNFTTGDAGNARITPFKIVRGLPLRSGGVPAGLLWSLDSVIRTIFVGGSQIFSFDPVTTKTSILSPASVIEYDGVYFWIGVDRFLYYDGAIHELPNDMNINFFFDNLNWHGRNLVWAMKFPRWGEIWWFFPKGDATECSHAVIFNVREKTWYDVELSRSAGYTAQVWRYPLMVGEHVEGATLSMVLTTVGGTFMRGEIVTGSISGATGKLVRILDLPLGDVKINVEPLTGTFISTDVVTGTESGGTGTVSGDPVAQVLTDAWLHDFGTDRVTETGPTSIHAWFESHDMGMPTGSAIEESPQGSNKWTRLARLEPDFVQSGEMVFKIIGKKYAQSTETTEPVGFPFNPDTEKIDLREQHRQFRLRFDSDTLGGDFQMGRVLLHVAPGDGRT